MKLIPTLLFIGGLSGGIFCAAEEAESGNQISLTIVQAKGGG